MNRCVVFIGGYDLKSPSRFFRRLERELGRFDALWSARSHISVPIVRLEGLLSEATVVSRLDGATSRCRFVFLSLDAIVARDLDRPLPVRLGRALVALGDYLASGALLRIARASWKFLLFFLYPFAVLGGFAALSAAVAHLLAGTLGRPVAASVGVAAFLALLAVPGRRWFVLQTLDLWSFCRAYLRGARDDADRLIERAAPAVVALADEEGFDELLFVGHSLGAALTLHLVERCLAIESRFAERARRAAVLSTGSIALALGLHPAARTFRARVERFSRQDRIGWVEVQSVADPINFHKVDPLAAMGLGGGRSGSGLGFPHLVRLRISDLVEPGFYRRVRRNVFRIHHQYVFANTRRHVYDFPMICFGPLALETRIANGILGSGIGHAGAP